MSGLNRRRFLQGTTAIGLAAGVSAALGPAFAQSPAEAKIAPDPALNGVALPDDGWTLWVDRDAAWKDDEIHLPGEFELANLPTHAPTGGWEVLDRPEAALELGKTVTLPATVEQFFWGRFGKHSYNGGTYVYEKRDPIPQNGAYLGVSWWCRSIDIPVSMQGKRILLRVRGARLRAEVYLNRRLVGYSIMEELPFECDLTPAARFDTGAPNCLAIRITNPGGRYDWADGDQTMWGKVHFYMGHGFGGLDRGLTLSACDAVRIEDAWVLNTREMRTVQCHAKLESIAATVEQGTVEFTAVDRRTGSTLVTQSVPATVPPGESVTVRATLASADAQLWTMDSPELYLLTTTWKGANTQDTRKVIFGFRSFGPEGLGRDALFRMNGERIKIYSSISWGFWGLNGLWPIPELAAKEVSQAKKLGLNCLNFHRNVGKEEVLRQHDEQGLLRYMEPGAGKLAMRIAGQDSPADLFGQRFMVAKILLMVRTFRSHPSLIQWTVHNEIGGAHMKSDNGMDMHDPDMKKILLAMHTEDPSRSVVLNDGFIAEGKPQAWYAPWDDTYRSSLDGPEVGWWNNHQGASDEWYDVFYKDPQNFVYLEKNRTEIVEWGEMEGIAVPDNHELLVHRIETHGGASYDLEDHKAILAAYNVFLDRWGFRKAFPTAGQLFRSIGRKCYESWEQYLENVRIADDVDFAVVSGWESTAIENHSGLVDNFRDFKSDPSDISGSLMPVRPTAKQRALVVQAGDPAVFDLYLLNDTGKPVAGKFKFSVVDPSRAKTELTAVAAPAHVKDQNSYLLKEAFATPPLTKTGVYRFRFGSSEHPLSTQTREILVVDAKPVMPRAIRAGVEGIPKALRAKLAAVDKVVIEEFTVRGRYDVLVSAGLTGEALSNDRIGDTYGDEGPASVTRLADPKAAKIPGRLSKGLIAAAQSGTPLLIVAQRDELADGVATQLAAAGSFIYNGQVGDFRAPWMGNWYFVRSHPVYADLPQDQAMSVFFQAQGQLSNGLLVDGPGVEIVAAYSRDHDRRIGAGTFTASIGKGRLLFQRVPDMQPLVQQRWLANAVAYLASNT